MGAQYSLGTVSACDSAVIHSFTVVAAADALKLVIVSSVACLIWVSAVCQRAGGVTVKWSLSACAEATTGDARGWQFCIHRLLSVVAFVFARQPPITMIAW